MPNPTSKLNLVINGTTTQLDIHDSNAVDLTSNQTVGGNKEFTGTTTAHDVIPSATETYNFGSSTAQWNNAYIKSLTINGVACGDILTHNVSEFVDLSSNQTIGGVKTFSDIPIVANGKTFVSKINADRTNGTQTGFSAYNGFKIVCNNDSQGWDNTAFAIHMHEYSPTRATVSFKLFDCIEGSLSYKGFGFSKNGNDFQLFPTASNAIGLGTSTNKWKSFNGINPGALSLPSSSYINVDTTNWDLTCQNELMGSFTPTADGWLMLHVANSGTSEVNFWIIGGVIRINNKSTLNTSDNKNFNMITIPVEKDKTYNIYGNASEYVAGRSIAYCRFMPCRGNV